MSNLALSVLRKQCICLPRHNHRVIPLSRWFSSNVDDTKSNESYAQNKWRSTTLDMEKLDKFDAHKPYKHWVSYGFHDEDIVIDRTRAHFFTSLTIFAIVTFTFYYIFMPQPKLKEWAAREAYIVIAEREAAGLPYINKELVPLDRIVLPAEEDLDDDDIVI